jgi:hypothetical protein
MSKGIRDVEIHEEQKEATVIMPVIRRFTRPLFPFSGKAEEVPDKRLPAPDGHPLRAGVRAFRAVDAGHLLALPDVDADGAGLDARAALHALVRAFGVEGNHECPVIEQHALQFRIGACRCAKPPAKGDQIEKEEHGEDDQ